MKSKISCLLLLALCQVISADPNSEAEKITVERPEFGAGKNYSRVLKAGNQNDFSLITHLNKGKDLYELTLSNENLFKIVTTSEKHPQKVFKFKLRQTFHVFLVDVYFTNESSATIALTYPPYGYHFIKFKVVNGFYIPYLYAEAHMVPGLDLTKSIRVESVGFNSSGDFSIKLSNGSLDIYSINEDKKILMRNNEIYNFSIVENFKDSLPKHLRLDP